MTLAELKSAVYRTAPGLGDFLDDGALTQFFNECQRLLAFDSQRLEVKDVDVVDGIFTLPPDCLVFKSASWEGRELSPWPGNSLPDIIEPQNWRTVRCSRRGNALQRPSRTLTVGTGYPAYYFQTGDTFYIIPKPQNAGGKVSVFYIARPQDMQLNSDIPSLANCDEVLVAYALWNVLKVMGEDDAANKWEKIYFERRQAWLLVNRATNYRHTKVSMTIKWR